MTQPKTHHIGGLTAYYTKKGRIWWVEKGDEQETFKSIEDMVEKYPKLLEVEAIKMSVERRALARTKTTPVTLREAMESAEILTKTVTCYYCAGSGEVAYMPCPECGGTGKIHLTTRGL